MSPETLLSLSLIVLVLPLTGFVLMMFFGKRLPRQGDWLETGIISAALVIAVTVLVQKLTAYHDETLQLNFTWVDLHDAPGIGPLKIVLGFAVDNLAAVMMVVVMIISTLVHYFSIGYMHGDVRYSRYFGYLGLFTFSMLMIVLANNLFLLYVGWELVGICSYLLIGHWYEKKSASDAGIKAFITNRIGDVGFFVGMAILFVTFNTFNLQEIFAGIAGREASVRQPALADRGRYPALLRCHRKVRAVPPARVVAGCDGGPDTGQRVDPCGHHGCCRACISWHGTFPLLTADALMVIAYIGATTAFISATIAIVQNDIKKVLAYPTISQLGYMVMGLGVGAYTAGFFHLATHAMFKAGLFLGSGFVIHAMHQALHHQHDHQTDPQDIRNMGGLREICRSPSGHSSIYTLAISGVPLTSGFLSKDAILAGTLAYGSLTGHMIIPIVGFLVAGLTAFYMFRLVILTFFGEHKNRRASAHLHESPKVMTVPLIILAVHVGIRHLSVSTRSMHPGGWIARAIERPDSVVPNALAAPRERSV